MKKQIKLSLLILFLVLCVSLPVFAASPSSQTAATALHELGLFQGTSQGYELDRTPSRQEGITMLVRLLGKEKIAFQTPGEHPFSDVAKWASPYVGYAYQNKLTQGKSATLFGGQDALTAPQYLTFLLRALGYQSNTDFNWAEATTFAKKIGLTDSGDQNNSHVFSRGDAAILSYRTLFQPLNGQTNHLLEKLVAEGVVSPQIAAQYTLDLLSAPSNNPTKNLEIHFLDVGQGDCIFLNLAGTTILIDAGKKSDAQTIMDYLKKQEIQKLDYLIATHPHADHIGAMAAVIEAFPIGTIYMPKVSTNTKTYETLLDTIAAKKQTIKSPAPGSVIPIGAATLKFLAPTKHYEDLNNNSLVVQLTYGETRFLFTGDMELLAEQDLLQTGVDLQSDLLKVAHHGSNTSSSQAFLTAVAPRYAVISLGTDNVYGHPRPEVLQRLTKMGAKIYRTDQDGTVIFFSDGKKITQPVPGSRS